MDATGCAGSTTQRTLLAAVLDGASLGQDHVASMRAQPPVMINGIWAAHHRFDDRFPALPAQLKMTIAGRIPFGLADRVVKRRSTSGDKDSPTDRAALTRQRRDDLILYDKDATASPAIGFPWRELTLRWPLAPGEVSPSWREILEVASSTRWSTASQI
jgi:hypothetical protein